MTENNLINEKALNFALRIYKLSVYLKEKKEYSLADQVLRSGCSIGANLSESISAESTEDYIHKVAIARKEGNETIFWLNLLRKTDLLEEKIYVSLKRDCQELLKMMSATITTLRKKSEK